MTERARISLMVCMSLDGRISTAENVSPNQEKYGGWTSAEDKLEFIAQVKGCDFLISGRKTAELLPDMKKRIAIISTAHAAVLTKQSGPIRVIRPDADFLNEMLETSNSYGWGKKALLCGGARTYTLFLQLGLVDEIWLTLEPIVLKSGPSFGLNELFKSDIWPTKFRMLNMGKLNTRGTLLLHYVKE